MILLIVAVTAGGCLLPGATVKASAAMPDSCVQAKNHVADFFDHHTLDSCRLDSDCRLTNEFSCTLPVFAYNHTVDLTLFRKAVRRYERDCEIPLCEPAPISPGIEPRCVNNRCVSVAVKKDD